MWDRFWLLILVAGIVDFVVQPLTVDGRRSRILLDDDLNRSVIHLFTMQVADWFHFGMVQLSWLPLILTASYFCADRGMRWFARQGQGASGFVFTQLARISTVAILGTQVLPSPGIIPAFAFSMPQISTSLSSPFIQQLLATGAIYVYVVFGGAAFVRYSLDGLKLNPASGGLPRAGALIGVFERLLILTFVLLQSYTAIAFVLTAKSVARFERITKDQQFAEYYLVGTLASASLAVLGGVLLGYIHSLY